MQLKSYMQFDGVNCGAICSTVLRLCIAYIPTYIMICMYM